MSIWFIVPIKKTVVVYFLVLLTACASPERKQALPSVQVQEAEISGLSNIRYAPQTKAGIDAYLNDVKAAASKRTASPYRKMTMLGISGGGDNGAFGAGLLVGWTKRGNRPQFDQVTGVSTGALIAPFAFLGSDYDPMLEDLFTKITPDDIYRERGSLSVVFSDAIADATPLKLLIDKAIDQEMLKRIAREYQQKGRLLLIGTTNIDTGMLVLWNMGKIAAAGSVPAQKLFRDIMLASAAVPGAFPPVLLEAEVDGEQFHELHVDGGLAAQVYLYPPPAGKVAFRSGLIKSSRKEAYIIRNARVTLDWEETERNGLGILGRSAKKMVQSQGMGNLYQLYLITQRDGIGFNLAYIGNDFDANHPKEFDRTYMNSLFQYAYQKSMKGYHWQHKPPGLEKSTEEDLLPKKNRKSLSYQSKKKPTS